MTTLAQGLYVALDAALAVSVYQDEAPEGATLPYVVFTHVAGPDEYTYTQRAATHHVVQVSVWDEGNDKTQAETIAAQVEAALTDQPLTVTGHKQTRRMDEFSFTVRENGKAYLQVGGNYRIVVGT